MLHRGVKRFRNFSRLRLRRSTWSEVKQASSENGGVTTWTTAAAFGKYRNARDADDAVSSTPTAVAAMAAELPSNAVATFFPAGYPGSVKEGYLQYVQLSVAGAVASSAGSVLSMQALLHAVGLGSGAIPMAAALNWVIKDGIGQLGGVIFAATVNTKFDGDPKRWRMVSSLALDTACMLELLAPAVPALFIPMAVMNMKKEANMYDQPVTDMAGYFLSTGFVLSSASVDWVGLGFGACECVDGCGCMW